MEDKQLVQPVENSSTEHIEKKESRLVRLFKNKIFIFFGLTFLTGLGGFFLLLLDDDNAFRSLLGITPESVAWLRNIFHLNVTLIIWLLFAILAGAAFFTFFIVVFKTNLKKAMVNRSIKKTGETMSAGSRVRFEIIYWTVFAILLAATVVGVIMMFVAVNAGSSLGQQISELSDPAKFGMALLQFLASSAIVLAFVCAIPAVVIVFWLIYRLIVLLFSGIAGGIAKNVMASSNFQETYAAAQAASSKINEMANQLPKTISITSTSNAFNVQSAGGMMGSPLGITGGNVLFPALMNIDSKYEEKPESDGEPLQIEEKKEEAPAAEENVAPAPVAEEQPKEASPEDLEEAEPAEVTEEDLSLQAMEEAASEEQPKEEVPAVEEQPKEEVAPEAKKERNFSTLIDEFRNYLAAQEKLYFSKNVLRTFVAGLSASRLILLEGLSGTGKSSLPRKFQQFIGGDSCFLQVQATWKDKTDIIGYYSDLTGYYKETELLKSIYEASYNPGIVNLMVLDEMNISRAEYYFADFLSIYEYPSEAWQIQLMQTAKDAVLPKKLPEGRLTIPTNVWFVGTINVDDSTFTVTDKVYDRAVVIDFDGINDPFEAKFDGELHPISYEELTGFFASCQENSKYCLSKAEKGKVNDLIRFLDDTFEIKVGNRIVNQIELFVPSFAGLGGSKNDALDMMICSKIFRKLDFVFDMNMGDLLIKLQRFLHSTFGKGALPKCEAKVKSLSRKYQ